MRGAWTRATLVALLLALAPPSPAPGATGCDLNYPDGDVPRLWPGSSGYRSRYVSLRPEQLTTVVASLDERYRALYDPLLVPYTIYEVLVDGQLAGYIHGVNQKGQFGGLQVFVVLDLEATIRGFYMQKITGPFAGAFRTPAFGRQLVGAALGDFATFDPVHGTGTGRLAAVRNPAPEAETDFLGILRGLKKNLVLMGVFAPPAPRKSP